MGGFNFNLGSGGSNPNNDLMKAFNFGGSGSGGGGQNQFQSFPAMTTANFGGPTANPSPAIFGTGGGTLAPLTSTNLGGSVPNPVQQPSGVPPGTPPFSGYPFGSMNPNLTGKAGAVGAADTLPGGAGTVPTTDPLFTQAMDAWLRQQMGTGISPFNLQSYLPSSNTMSGAGQVAAPLNPQLQQLMQFLTTGQGGGAGAQQMLDLAQTGGLSGPLGQLSQTGGLEGMLGQIAQTGGQSGALGQIGQTGGMSGILGQLLQSGGLSGVLGQLSQTGGLTGSLGQMAQNGSPISSLPEWQAMVNAQQTGIQQGQTNLKEQFGSMGNLSSSPAANAMALYNAQTTADQNSLLGQLQTSALENAQGRSLQAGEFGVGTQSQLGQFGVGTQSQLGQAGIQNQLSSLLPSLQAQLSALQGGVGTQLSADTSALGAQSGAASQLTGLGGQLGQFTQGLDQQSIQNLMQEFFMTQPQNNPLNNMIYGLGTTFPPSYTKQGGGVAGLIGALPGILGGAASGIGGGLAAAGEGAGGLASVLAGLAAI